MLKNYFLLYTIKKALYYMVCFEAKCFVYYIFCLLSWQFQKLLTSMSIPALTKLSDPLLKNSNLLTTHILSGSLQHDICPLYYE
jgi:hypothetical protein